MVSVIILNLNQKSNEELVKLYQEGTNEALEQLIENNQRMIYKIANKYKNILDGKRIDYEDLISEGNLGLILAAKKYNSELQNKCNFLTYAVYWIRRRINNYINGRNDKEIANNNLYNSCTSLYKPISEEENTYIVDVLKDNTTDELYEAVEEKVLISALHRDLDIAMIENLTLKEREILKARFAWDSDKYTLDELAEIYGCVRERIRQIQVKSIRKLKNTTWARVSGKNYYKELTGIDLDNIKESAKDNSKFDFYDSLMRYRR